MGVGGGERDVVGDTVSAKAHAERRKRVGWVVVVGPVGLVYAGQQSTFGTPHSLSSGSAPRSLQLCAYWSVWNGMLQRKRI